MLHLVPIGRTPLENPDGQRYSKMAFDGQYFYCCTGKSNKVYKLTIDGKLMRCIGTRRAYCAICYDCKQNCFWAIAYAWRSTVFKLSSCLREIGSIGFACQDRWFHNISYDASGDNLLLCSGNLVAALAKNGFVFPLYNGEKNAQHEAVVQLFDSYLIGCKFSIGCPDILGILRANDCFDYLTCMPKHASLSSMCVGYQADGNDRLFILALQSDWRAYLLAYRIEQEELRAKICPPPLCECADDNQMIHVSIDKMDMQADILL